MDFNVEGAVIDAAAARAEEAERAQMHKSLQADLHALISASPMAVDVANVRRLLRRGGRSSLHGRVGGERRHVRGVVDAHLQPSPRLE